ncbi:HU family DNA-binding protein [Candidatus Curtissbacteria bacterium]|nr:HU family DNA-binding protein [Candidatus Curtissbacteria bacterium]
MTKNELVDKIVISGFGTFKVRSRATRTGRNPQTGTAIKIPGHKLPGFTAGKTLRRLIK